LRTFDHIQSAQPKLGSTTEAAAVKPASAIIGSSADGRFDYLCVFPPWFCRSSLSQMIERMAEAFGYIRSSFCPSSVADDAKPAASGPCLLRGGHLEHRSATSRLAGLHLLAELMGRIE
jgi:hypothetical protein